MPKRKPGLYWTDYTLFRFKPFPGSGTGTFEQYHGRERGWEDAVPSEDDYWRMEWVPLRDREARIAQVDEMRRTKSIVGPP